MTATSATSPATVVSDSTVGTVSWSSPSNAVSSNDSRATAALNSSTSEYLKATNLSLAVPTNAIINGIKVEVEKSRTAGTGTLSDTTVKLVKRGNITGQNRASQGSSWTGSDATSTYGGETDLWGAVWTAAEINAYDFGVVFSCSETAGSSATAGVDHIAITVYYQSGYLASPQVQQAGEVVLFGQRYRLASEQGRAGKVKVTLGAQFSPKIDTGGPFGRPSNPVVETYEVNDLRGGMGVWRYRYDENGVRQDTNRFWTADSMDTLWANAITLGPLLTNLSQPASLSDGEQTVVAASLSGDLVIALSNAEVYSYTGSWSTAEDTLPGAPLNVCNFNSRVFYALGSNGYSYQTDVTATATDVAAPTAMDFVVWDDRIWTIATDFQLHSSTTGNSASWDDLATIPVDTTVAKPWASLRVHDDQSGEPVIWALTHQGPYVYDAANDKWFRSRFDFPYERTDLNRRDGGITHRGALYVWAYNTSVYRLDGSDIFDVSLDRPDGLPSAYGGAQLSFAQTDRALFAVMGGHLRSLTANPVFLWNGAGWHPIAKASHANVSTTAECHIWVLGPDLGGTELQRLVFSAPNNSSLTDDLYYFNLGEFYRHPLVSTARTYATAGNVELPYFDASAPSKPKIAQQVRLKLVGASTTETVTVAYRINGSTSSYTTLGSAVAVNNEVTIPFGSDGVGLEFNSIQFKLTFASGGSTSAPKLEYFAMDYVRQPEVLRAFVVDIDVSDFVFGRSPQQQIDDLWAHMKATTFGTFAYHDDADNTRSYLVKVLAPEGEEDSGYSGTGTYRVRLIEMGEN